MYQDMIKIVKKDNIRIRILQYFFLFVSMYGLIFLPYQWILLGIASYCFLETFAGNIGLHRYYGHKSFETSKSWDFILRFLSHYIGVGSVVSWVGQHRKHHHFSDTDYDVHNFRSLGLAKVLFGVWDVTIEKKYIKDVIKNDKLMWWHRNYWGFHVLLILVFSLIGVEFLFAFYALPNLMCLISGYVLAIVTHHHGYVTYELENDRSTNSCIANIYTLGEGWHNNHHANPKKLRQGEEWWEWDLPAFVVERFLDVNRTKK